MCDLGWFIHSLTQQIFIEHLLCSRHYCRSQEYSSDQKIKLAALVEFMFWWREINKLTSETYSVLGSLQCWEKMKQRKGQEV